MFLAAGALSLHVEAPSGAHVSPRTFSRRAALLPLLAGPAAATAFELPNPFSSGEPDKCDAKCKEAEKAAAKESKEAAYRRIRKERMAAEALAQNEEYVNRMNTYKFGTGTFGSTVSVPASPLAPAQ